MPQPDIRTRAAECRGRAAVADRKEIDRLEPRHRAGAVGHSGAGQPFRSDHRRRVGSCGDTAACTPRFFGPLWPSGWAEGRAVLWPRSAGSVRSIARTMRAAEVYRVSQPTCPDGRPPGQLNAALLRLRTSPPLALLIPPVGSGSDHLGEGSIGQRDQMQRVLTSLSQNLQRYRDRHF